MLRWFPVTNWRQTFMYSAFHCQNILRDFIKRGLLRYSRMQFEPRLCDSGGRCVNCMPSVTVC